LQGRHHAVQNAGLPTQSCFGRSTSKAPLARSEDSSLATGMSPLRSSAPGRSRRSLSRNAIVAPPAWVAEPGGAISQDRASTRSSFRGKAGLSGRSLGAPGRRRRRWLRKWRIGGARRRAGRDSLSVPDGYHERGAVAGWCLMVGVGSLRVQGPWHRRGEPLLIDRKRVTGDICRLSVASVTITKPSGHILRGGAHSVGLSDSGVV
jgi:hypothetical protein